MAGCTLKSGEIVSISRADTNDLTTLFTMRYKLSTDPDSSYAPVTTTKVIAGITMPYFDYNTLVEATYTVHTYFTADGDTTGTKVDIKVNCEDYYP